MDNFNCVPVRKFATPLSDFVVVVIAPATLPTSHRLAVALETGSDAYYN